MGCGRKQNGVDHPQPHQPMIRKPDIAAEFGKAWRLCSAPLRTKPSFVIPGAPKCGTSTLYDALCTHPLVRRGKRKEPTNFIHYPGSRLRCLMNYPLRPERLIRGPFVCADASVEYFTHPHAAEAVAEVLPDARLIFLFRDPVCRAWSDYQMFVKAGAETEPFRDAVLRSVDWLSQPGLDPLIQSAARNAFSPVRYLLNGMYEIQLQRWLKWYSRERCLFLISEEYFQNFDLTMARVVEFLQLPLHQFTCGQNISRMGSYSDAVDADTSLCLREFFKPHNARLAEFLGRSLPWPDA